MAEGSGVNVKDGDDAFLDDNGKEEEGVSPRRRQEMESLQVTRSPGNVSRGSPRPTKKTVDGNDLYEAIRLGTKPIQELANDWIHWYNKEQDLAVLELLQCFINAAGCSVPITLDMIRTISYKHLITQVIDEDDYCYDVNCSMNTTTVHDRKFRTNFQEFLELLFRSRQHCVVVDLPLLQHLISFVKALSVSAKRQFRYTGTFIAMKLTTAMVETAAVLNKKVDRIEEGQGEGVGAGTSDPEVRKASIELHEKLEDIFNSFFKTGLRSADFAPEIRAICISELGLWIVKYPQKFFVANCLKHLGLHLCDEVLAIKINCIKALQPLCDSAKFYSEKSGILAAFVKKFKNRIVEMAGDINSGTVPAINLLLSIFKNLPNILTVDDCDEVEELVYASNRTVAKTAGTFLMTNFWNTTKRGGKAALMRRLIEFLILHDPEQVPYVVDSLIDEYLLLKDWKCMTGLLLRFPAIDSDEVPFSDLELNMLIQLMVACVKQAATGETPEGRESTEKDEEEVEADQKLLTEHFLPLMEELLDTFMADPIKVANLLMIPRYFQFSTHLELPMKQGLETLWLKVSEVVAAHTDQNVLEACTKMYKTLCASGQISEEAHAWIDALVDEYLKDALKYREVRLRVNENLAEIHNVTVCLKKLVCFCSCNCFNYGDRPLFESLFYFVELGREWDKLPKDIAKHSITVCFHLLMQELAEMYNVDTGIEDKIASLGLKLKQLMEEFEFMMKYGRRCLQGFSTACDLLVIFGKPFRGRPHLNDLVYKPTDNCKTQFVDFIETYVFGDLASKYKVAVRQGFMASFCNLIQQNIVGVKFAAAILKNYLSFSRDFGDFIGETLKKAAEINVKGTARTMVISLSELFTQIKAETGKVDRRSPEFIAIKQLAKKFALLFEPAENFNFEEAIYALHSDGIGFAVTPFKNPEDPAGPPPNIAFLEILCELSNKLTQNDKNKILKFLDKHFGNDKERDGGEWFGLESYRRSLNARVLSSP